MIHLVIPDAHAHPNHHNRRAEWVGSLIHDLRPDVVIDMGDSADMPSLSSYDKGKRSFQGRTYRADVNAYLDFQDKLWRIARRSKKKLPRRVRLIGNHEQRIDRALDADPQLVGAIGYDDLELKRYYDDIVHYEGSTPGVLEIDGVYYAHFFVAGLLGRPIGGEHPAYQHLTKKFQSCTAGHSHVFDYKMRPTGDGKRTNMCLVSGCLVDYQTDWAGQMQALWNTGVAIKRGVENGRYDLEWVSLARLKELYGRPN